MRISDWSSDVCSSDLFEISYGGYDVPGPGPNIPGFTIKTPNIPRLHTGGTFTAPPGQREGLDMQIGRASCRERVCQYVLISVVAVSLTKNKQISQIRDRQMGAHRDNNIKLSAI